MKNIYLSVLTLLVLFSFSCKKNANDTDITGSATVISNGYGFDGSNLGKFSSAKVSIAQAVTAGVTTFTITAIKDGSNETITIMLLQKAAEGKIKLGPTENNGAIVISKDYTKAADGLLNYTTSNSGNMQGGGEVNITKVSGNNIEGSFYAVAFNSAGKEAFAEQGTFKGVIK